MNCCYVTNQSSSQVICRHPRILLCDPEKTLLPKFQILKSIGLSRTDLNAIVTATPQAIMRSKFKDTAPPCVDYLRTVLGSRDLVISAIKRFPLALTYDLQVYAAENIQMLLEVGVSYSTIQAVLARQPRTFFTSADTFRKVVKDVMEMGCNPKKVRFLMAIHALRSMSKSTWGKKLAIYKKWGWSKDEIFIAFERYPGLMMSSEDKIVRMLDFLVNTMGWEMSYIVQRPIVICFSLEKRVIPRCLVYQYVAEKGLIKENEDFCFTKWLMYSETKFLNWAMKRYEDEAPEILKLYRKHLNEANGSSTSILRKRDVI
ncbi:putative transcription regulator mTERF family [Helianthus annuus]|uniref:Transcription regulator mTERF family n=1 Tax=Helianthus annuus TaxID=4232 RepID=A0A9K3ISL3_HELAN|nr:putative transcription regulator mTERF family [Helianthus annuus]KAJ0915360.1 putative transcription regulator mTERF family [Helianthus annuus]